MYIKFIHARSSLILICRSAVSNTVWWDAEQWNSPNADPRIAYFIKSPSPLLRRPHIRSMSEKANDAVQLRLKQIKAHVLRPHVTDYPVPHYASTAPSNRLEGKVAIITGCNSEKGLGRATATIFAASGAKAIVISDIDSSNLQRWTNEIGNRYPNTSVVWRKFDAAGNVKKLNYVTDFNR